MEVFKDYAYYYNMFYGDKDYAGEAMTVKGLIDRYRGNKEITTLLDMGCGTGRHDFELAKLGYQMTGIDLSEAMIAVAKSTSDGGCALVFEVADIRSYKPSRKYDAVISLFHVMSYQNTNDDVLNTFLSARRMLSEGGYFLFDVWYGPGVLSDKPNVRVKEIEDDKNRLIRIARPIMHDRNNLVDVNYEVLIINKETNKVQTFNEVHKMRYFFRPELEVFLAEANFKLIDNIDCQTLGETDYNSWTSYFIAKAI